MVKLKFRNLSIWKRHYLLTEKHIIIIIIIIFLINAFGLRQSILTMVMIQIELPKYLNILQYIT